MGGALFEGTAGGSRGWKMGSADVSFAYAYSFSWRWHTHGLLFLTEPEKKHAAIILVVQPHILVCSLGESISPLSSLRMTDVRRRLTDSDASLAVSLLNGALTRQKGLVLGDEPALIHVRPLSRPSPDLKTLRVDSDWIQARNTIKTG